MTGARVIDGRAIADRVRGDVAQDVEAMVQRGVRPGLATILIGSDPASAVYVRAKRRACEAAGIASFHYELEADVTQSEVLELIAQLNEAPGVSGILCQLPVPAPLDGAELTNGIAPGKDVDGLTVASAGRLALGLSGLRPCTPSGVMELLDDVGVELQGALAVVVGRSNLFGKPMGQLLLAANATVVTCHSATREAPALARQADVLVVAAGRPGLVTRDWVAPGAIVIDVGINRTADGLVGDVAFDDVATVAGVITPVPGGVGPMTIACLLRNTVQAAAVNES
jgi:methylenetetrahydrofolate dehydrogenase (NADP+) / methenyltetrahydrofolate cyclohydrolase